MNLTRLTPPATLPVSLAEAKAYCRVDHFDDDAVLSEHIAAVVSRLDGCDGMLGICLVRQTWRADLPGFHPIMVLPLPPALSVASVAYVDPAGDLRTLPSSAWRVAGLGSLSGATVVPASGTSWPATAEQPDAVRITFDAGFGNDAAAVPAAIKAHILARVAWHYDNREALPSDPKAEDDYVRGFRAWSF